MFKVKYSKMQNKSQNPQQIFISEEEKTINWEIVQKNFDKIFGREVYNSWLKDVSLIKNLMIILFLEFQHVFSEMDSIKILR